jgi:hypothetical protein
MPGYNIGVPLPFSLFMPFAIKYLNLSGAQVKMIEPLLNTAPAFVTITTKGDDLSDFLRTGEVFEKIFLEAEKDGIKIGVFGAPIEIGENYKELQKILGTKERPQMFFRMGYSKEVPIMSPRLDGGCNKHIVIANQGETIRIYYFSGLLRKLLAMTGIYGYSSHRFAYIFTHLFRSSTSP